MPAPRRGELVRLLGEALRAHKQDLGRLVTIETGKILSEGLGEVQEMIDICDFAVGLSRQLYGLTIATERPQHRMMETWHPLGRGRHHHRRSTFPVAVWAWNAALALVCGDPVMWKPSEKTPLTALATQSLFEAARAQVSAMRPTGLSAVLIGGREVGAALADDPRVPLVSATGSTRMGRAVGRTARAAVSAGPLLELGGNNAAIVAPSRRSRSRRARDRLRGDRHGRPALHLAAAPDRARRYLRLRSSPAGSRCLRHGRLSAIRARRRRWSGR